LTACWQKQLKNKTRMRVANTGFFF
jgi:hypothetical protein